MSANLHSFAKHWRDELVQTVLKRLRASDSPSYRRAKLDLLRTRSEKLVDAFIRSLRGSSAHFVVHVEKLTEERIAEGYYLTEIQLALSILEEQAWRLATEHSNISNLVPNLAQITATIGTAKDRLAQIYLAHKEEAETAAARLEQALLARGTESLVMPEE